MQTENAFHFNGYHPNLCFTAFFFVFSRAVLEVPARGHRLREPGDREDAALEGEGDRCTVKGDAGDGGEGDTPNFDGGEPGRGRVAAVDDVGRGSTGSGDEIDQGVLTVLESVKGLAVVQEEIARGGLCAVERKDDGERGQTGSGGREGCVLGREDVSWTEEEELFFYFI